MKFGTSEGFGPVAAPNYAGAVPKVIAGFVGTGDKGTKVIIGYIPKDSKIIRRQTTVETAFDGSTPYLKVSKRPVDVSGKVTAGSYTLEGVLASSAVAPASATTAPVVNGIALSVTESSWTTGHNAWEVSVDFAHAGTSTTGKLHVVITYLEPEDSEWFLATTRHA